MPEKYKTEREWCDLLKTQSKESAELKATLDHNYSTIRDWVEKAGGLQGCASVCAEYALQGGITEGFFEKLNDIHPRALLLIAKYGEDFRAISWDSEVEPTEGACFGNAWIQMLVFNQRRRKEKSAQRMFYVEGVAFSGGDRAVHHAWNTGTGWDDVAFDWTWYAFAGWCFYFGIPLAQRQYAVLRKLAYPDGKFHLLFSQEAFPRIEKTLTHMLERRQAQQQRKLKKQLFVPDRDF